MPSKAGRDTPSSEITREQLIALLNEDLAREYQATIAYIVYSQVIKGAEYMYIAKELETHAAEEMAHALTIAKQIDYLGGEPTVVPKPVRTSKKARDMLQFDLDAENETIRNYRQRVRQCEALGEYGMAEQIRQIIVQEQDHQIELATALGVDVPDVTKPEECVMIRKLKSGEYRLYSRKIDPKSGKRRNLGTFGSRPAAEKHERAIQFFKRHG